MSPQAATPNTSIAERQIERAKELERRRSDLMKEVAANREFLRLLADNGELSDTQVDWVDTFYPQKEKGEQRSKDEIEATRKAREDARKVTS